MRERVPVTRVCASARARARSPPSENGVIVVDIARQRTRENKRDGAPQVFVENREYLRIIRAASVWRAISPILYLLIFDEFHVVPILLVYFKQN